MQGDEKLDSRVIVTNPDLNFNNFYDDIDFDQDVSAWMEQVNTSHDTLKLAALWPSPEIIESASTPDVRELLDAELRAIFDSLPDSNLELVKKYKQQYFQANVPAVSIWYCESPFSDIVGACEQFFEFARKRNIPIDYAPSCPAPSLFISSSLIPKPSDDNEATRKVFQDIFMTTGRLGHLERILGFHPMYLDNYLKTLEAVMNDEGPLPRPHRHYLAIMAASRYKCDYIIAREETLFIKYGGDPHWLDNVDAVPDKIKKLSECNAFLAHQPWQVKPAMVAVMLTEHHWSVGELVHAIVILTTYHSLCGVVLGVGITSEVEVFGAVDTKSLQRGNVQSPKPVNGCESAESGNGNGDDVFRLEEMLEERESTNRASHSTDQQFEPTDESDSNTLNNFLKFAAEDAKVEDVKEEKVEPTKRVHRYSHYDLPALSYTDFLIREEFYKVFRTEEFSWKEHGYALISRFYNQEVADLIDSEFECIYSLSYGTLGTRQNINTGPFRRSVWYYTQRLFGICHDDYDYSEPNNMLGKNIKLYVKKVACHPNSITISDFETLGFKFLQSEKVHIALLIFESRRMASLLYGLHAVMMHMNPPS